MKDIDAAAAQQLIQASADVRMLDVREPWELAIAAIKLALHIPMQDVPDRLEELDPACAWIVVCHHGNRSRVVARYLEQNGYDRVFNLEGGIESWARHVDPAVGEY